MMKQDNEGIRKAAVLVSALDRKAADTLLDQMGPEQAARVRQAVIEQGPFDPGEQRRIVDEFFHGSPPPSISESSEEVERPVGGTRVEDTRSTDPPSGVRPSGEKPFHFLRETPPDKLAEILTTERPQTIAIVLSHLDRGQAGEVLVRFPGALQVEIVHRLVDLEEADSEILLDVETALQARLARSRTTHRRKTAGMSAVTGILKASNGNVGGRILDTLARHDNALAQRLGPKRLEFNDLIHLDNETWTVILQASEPDIAILALTGAPDQLIHRILAGLPDDQSESIRGHLGHLGPTRLSDVEEAQRRMAHIAWRLATSGRIDLPHKPNRPVTAVAAQYAQWA